MCNDVQGVAKQNVLHAVSPKRIVCLLKLDVLNVFSFLITYLQKLFLK